MRDAGDIKTLAGAAAIVAAGAVLGDLAPTTVYPFDEAFLLDAAWRMALGQHPASDFLNPVGFGLFWLAGRFWELGDFRLPMLLAQAGFSLVIVALTARLLPRELPGGVPAGLRALFLLGLAGLASAPVVYGHGAEAVGFAAVYNRLSVAALAGLFAGTVGAWPARRGGTVAGLLCVLFLLKVSAFVLGVGVVALAVMLAARPGLALAELARRVLPLLLMLIGLSLWLAGVDPLALWAQYRELAGTRMALVAHAALTERAEENWVVFAAAGALGLHALLAVAPVAARARAVLAIGGVMAAQLVLNLTNTQPPTLALLGAAAVMLHLRLRPPAAGELPVRAPFHLLCAMMLVMQGGQLLGVAATAGWAMAGAAETVSLSAGGRHGWTVLDVDGAGRAVDFVRKTQAGLAVLETLKVGDDRVAVLDYANPISFLRRAPPPRLVSVAIAPGYMLAEVTAARLIGDACVVMRPVEFTPVVEGAEAAVAAAVAGVLREDFVLVYADDVWLVYRRRVVPGSRAQGLGQLGHCG